MSIENAETAWKRWASERGWGTDDMHTAFVAGYEAQSVVLRQLLEQQNLLLAQAPVVVLDAQQSATLEAALHRPAQAIPALTDLLKA